MTDDIRPECRVSIQHMQQEISEIHDVVYKNGLVTQVTRNCDRISDNGKEIDKISANLSKALWMIGSLLLGFIGQFIWNLVQNSP